MKIFKTKFFIASLFSHFVVITFLLLFQNSNEKAETFMLVTEIINVKETSKTSDIKKDISEEKNEKQKILQIKKPIQKNNFNKVSLKRESYTKSKTNKLGSEENKKNIKDFSVDNQTVNNKGLSDKKKSEKISEEKELSKANYKIGSINNPHPPYPLIARKKGLEGKVTLKVFVNSDGSVKNVVVGKSSGHKILDNVSKETIEKWIFIPAKKMGRTIKDKVQVPIKFVLTDNISI